MSIEQEGLDVVEMKLKHLGGYWVPSNELTPAEIAFAQAACDDRWYVNAQGKGWACSASFTSQTRNGGRIWCSLLCRCSSSQWRTSFKGWDRNEHATSNSRTR